jgi:hypothetical protein
VSFGELKVAAFIKKFIALCEIQSLTAFFKAAYHCSAYNPEDRGFQTFAVL